MTNVYAACWTMSETAFRGQSTKGRVDTLQTIAFSADTQLKIRGNSAGGDYSRILVVPEYVFSAGASILGRDDKHRIYRQLENISAQVPELIIFAGTIAYKKGFISRSTYNVCPVLKGGHIIKKLYKSNDDGVYEVNGSFRSKSDGGKGVPVVTIDGISFGLDICMDFNQHRLKNYLNTNGLERPDIHIQISGTNNSGAVNAEAKLGGAYLHCDLGGKGVNGASAWRIDAHNGGDGAATTRIAPAQTLVMGCGRLMLFDLTV